MAVPKKVATPKLKIQTKSSVNFAITWFPTLNEAQNYFVRTQPNTHTPNNVMEVSQNSLFLPSGSFAIAMILSAYSCNGFRLGRRSPLPFFFFRASIFATSTDNLSKTTRF